MNILYISDYYYPHIGGVEKLFESLATNMADRGNKVFYITWKHEKDLPKHEVLRGVEITRVWAPNRLLFPFFALAAILKCARKADIIHTSTYSSAIGAWLGGVLTRTKVIVTVHEVWGSLWKKLPFLSGIEKLLFRIMENAMFMLPFSHYITVSENTKKGLVKKGIKEGKVTRIYNAVECDLPKWSKPDMPFIFTFFGRAGVSKGLDLLLGAAKKIAGTNSPVNFKFIVSHQSPKVLKWLKQQVSSDFLVGVSVLMQDIPREKLIKELLLSHCVIIPSYSEGFGFTAVEASLMGVPLISSQQGSLPEVVSGKVIKMNDYSVEGLIVAMQEAMLNEFETIPPKEFPISDFIVKHLDLYNQIKTTSNRKF
jgi:glycosyltransferase involved in cell wall biosynthesis